jgi:hypothetical protein
LEGEPGCEAAAEADGDEAAHRHGHERRPVAVGLEHDPVPLDRPAGDGGEKARPRSSAPRDHSTTARAHSTEISPELR